MSVLTRDEFTNLLDLILPDYPIPSQEDHDQQGPLNAILAHDAALRAALDAALARAEMLTIERGRLQNELAKRLFDTGLRDTTMSELAAARAEAESLRRDLAEAEQGHAGWRDHYTRTLAERDEARKKHDAEKDSRIYWQNAYDGMRKERDAARAEAACWKGAAEQFKDEAKEMRARLDQYEAVGIHSVEEALNRIHANLKCAKDLSALIETWRSERAHIGVPMTWPDRNLIDGFKGLRVAGALAAAKTTFVHRPTCTTCAGTGKVARPCDDPNCKAAGCDAGGAVLCPDCREF